MPILTDFLYTRNIDVITLIWRGLPLSICRHMRHDIFLLPFRPLADKKVRLLPWDPYACVTRHGDIHKIAEKLRRENGRMGEKSILSALSSTTTGSRPPVVPRGRGHLGENEKLLRRRASRQISWHEAERQRTYEKEDRWNKFGVNRVFEIVEGTK